MGRRTAPPFRADHVGSLLRPPGLLRVRDDHAAGKATDDQLRAVEDEAVREVVRMQEDIGLQSATDGELRRAEWHTDFIKHIGGFAESTVGVDVVAHTEGGGTIPYTAYEWAVTGKVELDETIFGDDFAVLREAVTTATPKQTIPSPSMAHFRADISGSVYADQEEFRGAVAAAYAEELRRMVGLGCTYLQLDDTLFAFLNDPNWRATVANPDNQHEINLRVLNQALAARPEGLTVTVHMCRGNYQSGWFSEGGYDFVAEAVFSQLDADGFFLEYDDARSGSFEPLRFVPDDKLVVLGLVTSKTPELESVDDLKRRVEEASRYVDADRLCLSPQCGFASTVAGNALTRDQQRAKLELVVRAAEEIWG